MAHTSVRIAELEEELEETVRKYSDKFKEGKSALENSEQYVLYRTNPAPQLIMVSKSLVGRNQTPGYNTQLTITSDDQPYNEETCRAFAEKTGIPLKTAPRGLVSIMENLGIVFEALKEQGDSAFDMMGTKP